MNRETYEKTEAFADTSLHSAMAVTSGVYENAIPSNCHVAFGLMSNLQVMPVGGDILRALSVFCYENPDVASKIWEAIEGTVKAAQ